MYGSMLEDEHIPVRRDRRVGALCDGDLPRRLRPQPNDVGVRVRQETKRSI
jgi:hypothetical protein